MALNAAINYPVFNFVPSQNNNQQTLNSVFEQFQQSGQAGTGFLDAFQDLESMLSSMSPMANQGGQNPLMLFLSQLMQMFAPQSNQAMGLNSPFAVNNSSPSYSTGGSGGSSGSCGGVNSGSSFGSIFGNSNNGGIFGSGGTNKSGRSSGIGGASFSLSNATPSDVTNNPGPGVYSGVRLNQTQINNARIIAEVGQQKGMSQRDIAIGIATAMQESTLNNLNYGDRDSLGLFQQRPSCGWGSPQQVTDPKYAAGKFFDALSDVKNRDSMSLTKAAQTVQRSAFPNAYAQWENMATELTKEITKTTIEDASEGLIADNVESTEETTDSKMTGNKDETSKSTEVASNDTKSSDSKTSDSKSKSSDSKSVASNDSKSSSKSESKSKSEKSSSESTA